MLIHNKNVWCMLCLIPSSEAAHLNDQIQSVYHVCILDTKQYTDIGSKVLNSRLVVIWILLAK